MVSSRAVRSRVIETFIITCQGRKASELVKLGRYDWVDKWVTDERFPIEPHGLIERRIDMVQCEYTPSHEEAFEELSRYGLRRPNYEDALEFGIKYPDEQRLRPLVFLPELVLGSVGGDPHNNRRVLAVRGRFVRGSSTFGLYSSGGGWRQNCVFAGIRE